jgi:3-deoxy-D-manno-octulosonic acid kinase
MEEPGAVGERMVMAGPAGEATIVFDRTRVPQAEASMLPMLFDPLHYGARAGRVGVGGRGAAWFVEGPFGAGVLRHYLRGGWMARLSRDRFAWRGASAARSLREFELLARLRAAGLPVPAPIAALATRRGMTYSAAILVARLPGVDSLAIRVAELGDAAPWESVGAAIAAFHRQGAHHADLNANNVLLDSAQATWLIDWDKGVLEDGPGAWCGRVLARLARSLRKECRALPIAVLEAGIARLRAAHDAALVDAVPALRA